jgi:predicted TIM-barrel fold metal-dependent hydrolase
MLGKRCLPMTTQNDQTRRNTFMIVDFQHHFVPRELGPGADAEAKTVYDEHGVPSYSFHGLLYDLDEHVAMMDEAGIDAATLSCAEGMCGTLEKSKIINNAAKKAENDYPGRFIGTAHAHPLGGKDAMAELSRCADELGFPGIVICSEFNMTLDDAALNPFWEECQRRGLYVFVHPALRLDHPEPFDAYDMGRSIGREFSMALAVIRLINGGVLDRFPELTIQIAHLGGGIASVLGRLRSYQDKDFWGTRGNERHGCLPQHDFDYYLRERLVFDTAGFCGAISSVKSSLVELPSSRIVYATDYPQEIRKRAKVKQFVDEVRDLGDDGAAILDGNTGLLIPGA